MEEFISKNSLQRAFNYDLNRNTDKFELLVVGHSLGAGKLISFNFFFESTFQRLKSFLKESVPYCPFYLDQNIQKYNAILTVLLADC